MPYVYILSMLHSRSDRLIGCVLGLDDSGCSGGAMGRSYWHYRHSAQRRKEGQVRFPVYKCNVLNREFLTNMSIQSLALLN